MIRDIENKRTKKGKTFDVCVVIPAFNEQQVIANVLQKLDYDSYQVVVVDDGSTDDTRRIILQFPIILLSHAINLGQGAALQTGITYALDDPNINYIVTFDADGQHQPEDINKLVKKIKTKKYDVVLGSRFLRKGDVVNIPKSRHFILQLAIKFTRIRTKMDLTDTHNGLKAFTVGAANKIQITRNGMAHGTEILDQIAENKFSYCEIPVKIVYSDYSLKKGQSILNSINILWETFIGGSK